MQLKNLFKMPRYSEPALTESREYVIWNPEYRGLNMQTVHDLVEYEHAHHIMSKDGSNAILDQRELPLFYHITSAAKSNK